MNVRPPRSRYWRAWGKWNLSSLGSLRAFKSSNLSIICLFDCRYDCSETLSITDFSAQPHIQWSATSSDGEVLVSSVVAVQNVRSILLAICLVIYLCIQYLKLLQQQFVSCPHSNLLRLSSLAFIDVQTSILSYCNHFIYKTTFLSFIWPHSLCRVLNTWWRQSVLMSESSLAAMTAKKTSFLGTDH